MAGPRYQADPPEAISWVELDGLTAIFHKPSGMTHILAPPSPQILEALAGSPADEGEILERIGAQFEVEGGEEAMGARLAELEAAGLISRL
jgi:PqqD family protein of HPr-rel-A system